MGFAPGARLGSYEITGQIGVGGMGEVYRATDTNLKRAVAIKVLPDAVATDPERLARFQREAEVLASLNHPNIASIYGLERTDGATALVMELVEGPTLADRIANGPIPIEEALAIAKQIADGLEAAHERAIIHRDLKPANVKVRSDGTVKVLDFGLAKAVEPAGVGNMVGAALSQSPTITTPAMTMGGVILGTAAYMSPEQAKGKPTDRRSDIWAFGCVVYEMLAGSPAFGGEDVSDTLANILKTDPAWTRLPSGTPESVRRLLRRALEKERKRRLSDIADARLELDETEQWPKHESAARRSKSAPWWLVAAVAVLMGAAGTFTAWLRVPEAAKSPLSRYTIRIPDGATISTTTSGYDVVLSPDGRTLLFSGPGSGVYKRRMDANDFAPLRGAETGRTPFFSPDGAWVGFVADGKLKKVPVEGGLPIPISDTPSLGTWATWHDDGTIIVAAGGDLFRVSENGGPVESILKAGGVDGNSFSQPRSLPGSNAVLVRNAGVTGGGTGHIEVIELSTLKRHRLVDGTAPQLSPDGDLLFQQQGAVWGVKFDVKRFAVDGAPVPLVESVWALGGNSAFSVARDGTLVYITGAPNSDRSMAWLDRSGKVTPALSFRGQFQSPRLSPDGKAAVISLADGGNLGLWRFEFERGTRQSLTPNANSRRTVWSPDGQLFAFYSTPTRSAGTDQDLYVMPSNGGEATLLLKRPGLQFPASWSPDGRFLIFEEGEGPGATAGSRRDLWLLPIRQTASGVEAESPRPLLASRFSERGAVFAPKGHQIAFVSDESGRPEVYVQPFPGPGPKTPVSANSGLQPMWSRKGDELFYREGDWLMAVPVRPEPFQVGIPRRLFEFSGATYNLDNNFADYDVAPDGRFLAIRSEGGGRSQDIQIVLNWSEQLRRALGR